MENRDKNRLAANVDAVVEQIGARLPAEQARAVALEQRQGSIGGGGALHAIKTHERGVL